jgi:hypothetical protein
MVTRDGTTVGTFDYISPEQARHSRSVDTRSDIYSLGCTLYHMIAGQVPFPAPSLPEKLYAHQLTEPEPLGTLVPGLPAGLEDVVRRMMKKAMEERYQSPLEVAQALEPFVAGAASLSQIIPIPVPAPPPRPIGAARRRGRIPTRPRTRGHRPSPRRSATRRRGPPSRWGRAGPGLGPGRGGGPGPALDAVGGGRALPGAGIGLEAGGSGPRGRGHGLEAGGAGLGLLRDDGRAGGLGGGRVGPDRPRPVEGAGPQGRSARDRLPEADRPLARVRDGRRPGRLAGVPGPVGRPYPGRDARGGHRRRRDAEDRDDLRADRDPLE